MLRLNPKEPKKLKIIYEVLEEPSTDGTIGTRLLTDTDTHAAQSPVSLVAGPEQAEQQSQIIDEVLDEPSTSKLDGTIGTKLVTDTYTPAAQPPGSLVACPEQARNNPKLRMKTCFSLSLLQMKLVWKKTINTWSKNFRVRMWF